MNTLIERVARAGNSRSEKDKETGFSARDLEFLQKKINELSALPIKINDNPACAVNDIRLESQLVKNLGLIAIDYLQLMRSSKKFESRNLEVGAICRELKCLASELGVPILCLSQLNRTSDESVRPSPSELRDSGSIEQDANKVILMWCIEKNLNKRGFVESKTIGIDVALNRRGTTGVTLFNFNGNYMQFTELDRKYEESKPKKIWR